MTQDLGISASALATDGLWRASATAQSRPLTGQETSNWHHSPRNRDNLDSAPEKTSSAHSVPSTSIDVAFPESRNIRMPSRTGVPFKFYNVRSSDIRLSPIPATATEDSTPETSLIDEWYTSLIPPELLQPLAPSAQKDDYSSFMYEAMKSFTTPYLELFASTFPPAGGSHEASTSSTIHHDVQAHPSTKAHYRYEDIVSNSGPQYSGLYYRTPPATTPEPFDGRSKIPSRGIVSTQGDTSSLPRQILVEIEATDNSNTPVALSPCSSVGKTANNEIHEMVKQAQAIAAQSESKTAVIQCGWDGCTERTLLNELPEHLGSAHHVELRGDKKVRCLWSHGEQCKSEIMGKSMRKHLLIHGRCGLGVKCPTCGRGFEAANLLECHLVGNR
ncbi:hypothetical protein MSAN_01991700 [Mycena sanguinolenta]|uniref:Uncharacterized protein n=1 Tax=Mycena sanguinolenta TaxID=230812 RepID=A0A8H6XJK4_9AGAR|nr:hypothetical protein MSAN_01991700 [Mycena sanguinolenta]